MCYAVKSSHRGCSDIMTSFDAHSSRPRTLNQSRNNQPHSQLTSHREEEVPAVVVVAMVMGMVDGGDGGGSGSGRRGWCYVGEFTQGWY